MSTLSAFRFVGGLAVSRTFGNQLVVRALPATSVFPKKTLMLSPALKKRYYGPEEEHEKHDEIAHWKNERYVTLALLPIIPAALAFPNPVLDTALVSAMLLHTHWRLTGVVTDYIHGEMLPKIGRSLVLFLSIFAFGSLSYFNYSDIGFANAVHMLYSQL